MSRLGRFMYTKKYFGSNFNKYFGQTAKKPPGSTLTRPGASINITFDASGVINVWKQLQFNLSEANTLGYIMREAAFAIIVPHAAARFTGQRVEPGMPSPSVWSRSRYKEDPVGPLSDIASQPFSDSGREEALFSAIMSREWVGRPMKQGYSIMLGIGNIDLMNMACEIQQAKGGGGQHHYLWMILEAGTGRFATDFQYGDKLSTGSKTPIIRNGLQVFFDRTAASPTQWVKVMATQTENPGQVGRHFLFNMNGLWYDSDKEVGGWLYAYFKQQVARFSAKAPASSGFTTTTTPPVLFT